jgi:lysophospholipase L1-like esterase
MVGSPMLLSRLIGLVAVASIVACSTATRPAVEPAPGPSTAKQPAPTASTTTASTAEPPTVPENVVATASTDDAKFVSRTPELSRFHDALHGLSTKTRSDHVRVLWLGDSHGQADFWSGQVRKLLGERFGKAGPGFVHLGYKNYRHDGLKLDIRGKWRMRPKKPVGVKRQGDGVYGLGGLMMSGYADSPRVALTLTEPIPGSKVKMDLCYRFVEEGDALAISIDGGDEKTLYAKDGKSGKLGQVVHLPLVASSAEPLVVRPIGRTDLCGVVVESDPAERPGVVVDTLAINGARYGTALAWDDAAWKAEVARRKPDLVVFEYGTNEAGDLNPSYTKVASQVGELLERVRSVAPGTDCIVVSPTDRGDAAEKVTKMRESVLAAAKEKGCYFFDAWQILGGEGSSAKLAAVPDGTVQKDEIHLTIKGYRQLGTTMFDALIAGYGSEHLASKP